LFNLHPKFTTAYTCKGRTTRATQQARHKAKSYLFEVLPHEKNCIIYMQEFFDTPHVFLLEALGKTASEVKKREHITPPSA
jgi:hypothetical protein